MSFAEVLAQTQVKLFNEQNKYKRTGVKSDWLSRFERMMVRG